MNSFIDFHEKFRTEFQMLKVPYSIEWHAETVLHVVDFFCSTCFAFF